MKARLLGQSLLILALAHPLLATYDADDEIESVTGTREPEPEYPTTTEITMPVATTVQSFRQSRWYRPSGHGRGGEAHDDHDDVPEYHDHHDDMPAEAMKAISTDTTGDYWGGYYDFLINEGSYKFWAVFQLATAALLIYSGFAAVYYAKVNPPTDDDYEDYFLRRRRSVGRPPQERTFLGLSPEAFQRILDAVAREFH